MNYDDFLAAKRIVVEPTGIEVTATAVKNLKRALKAKAQIGLFDQAVGK